MMWCVWCHASTIDYRPVCPLHELRKREIEREGEGGEGERDGKREVGGGRERWKERGREEEREREGERKGSMPGEENAVWRVASE